MSIIKLLKKIYYQGLRIQDIWLGDLSRHAMKWRGFSKTAVHPKHIFDEERNSLLHSLFRPGINFLDIGSGVGTDCILAKNKGAVNAVGLEGNIDNLNISAARAEEEGVNVEFIRYDLEKASLPVKDGFYDLVNFSNVLEHLHNRNAILKDLKNKINPDGVIVISIPNTDTTWKKKLRSAGLDSYDDADHKIEYSRQTLNEEMHNADLKIVSDLLPIVPSFPWNGLIAMSAGLSPESYKRLQKKKRQYVEQHPEESIGWVFLAR